MNGVTMGWTFPTQKVHQIKEKMGIKGVSAEAVSHFSVTFDQSESGMFN